MPSKRSSTAAKNVDHSGPSREWSWKAERDLLMTIIAFGISNSGRVVNWDLVHEEFKTRGHTNSRNACQTRWTREIGTEIRTIRRRFAAVGEASAGSADEMPGEDRDAIEETEEDIGKSSQAREADNSAKYLDVDPDPLLMNPFAPAKSMARKARHKTHASTRDMSTNTRDIKSLRSESAPKVPGSPIMATINDLLPIVDPLGKVRGFITTQNQLPSVDANDPHPTRIKSILEKFEYQSSSISGMLIASDNEFLNSISVFSSENEKALDSGSGGSPSSTFNKNVNTAGMQAHLENTHGWEEVQIGSRPIQQGVEPDDSRPWQSTSNVAESSTSNRELPYSIENIDPRLLAMIGSNTHDDNFDIFEYVHNDPEPSFDISGIDFKPETGKSLMDPGDTGNGGGTDEGY